eukprot:CAMPEP_0182421908 /NCGR_PEP_ID=MMETSP1167-20130531/7472_1 /TAXON_ID=2988 /ORGANISM="Mallomonas Sp, Strain CCMP3275" /LENGTH=143 /DNA_ID=CAMNT_0024599527 /DNA_START=57 /DNA_END=485 /DNA_ORIENTATION=-
MQNTDTTGSADEHDNFSKVDSSVQDALRNELVNFLEECRHKSGDDGKPLIVYPKNFEKVVEAMDRRDLLSSDPNNWSVSMLNDKFDEEMKSSFEDGRYRHVLEETAEEIRVKRGLSEIHMLDRQLQSLTKRAQHINSNNASTK